MVVFYLKKHLWLFRFAQEEINLQKPDLNPYLKLNTLTHAQVIIIQKEQSPLKRFLMGKEQAMCNASMYEFKYGALMYFSLSAYDLLGCWIECSDSEHQREGF